MLDLAVNNNIVEKSGAWFSYKTERIGQGRENAKQFLKENKDIAAKIEAEVRKTLGIGVSSEPKPETAAPSNGSAGAHVPPVVAAARAMNAPRK
jgi:recombination protein RecA